MMAKAEAITYPISLNDMRNAAESLDGVVIRTPLLENPDVNETLADRRTSSSFCVISAESWFFTGSQSLAA